MADVGDPGWGRRPAVRGAPFFSIARRVNPAEATPSDVAPYVKAPDFDYVKPDSLDQVHTLLEEYGDDARILAGGQSLLSTLNLRLS